MNPEGALSFAQQRVGFFARVRCAPVPHGLKRYYGQRHLHFITASCYRRLPLLTPRRRDQFVRVLEESAQVRLRRPRLRCNARGSNKFLASFPTYLVLWMSRPGGPHERARKFFLFRILP